LAAVGAVAAAVVTLSFFAVDAQERTGTGQKLLPVDWGNSEVAAAATRGQLEGTRSLKGVTGGLDPARLGALEIPVLAFSETPLLVRNILGADAKPVKPRSLVSDPKQPYWYEIEDHYQDITISVAADRRVNLEVNRNFQIGTRSSGAEASLGTKAAPKVSITDGATEEGMEGVILSYTLARFPDIPYTITIECTGAKRQLCKDVGTIAKDQALLKVISARPK
jgi:hypothetical protein